MLCHSKNTSSDWIENWHVWPRAVSHQINCLHWVFQHWPKSVYIDVCGTTPIFEPRQGISSPPPPWALFKGVSLPASCSQGWNRECGELGQHKSRQGCCCKCRQLVRAVYSKIVRYIWECPAIQRQTTIVYNFNQPQIALFCCLLFFFFTKNKHWPRNEASKKRKCRLQNHLISVTLT